MTAKSTVDQIRARFDADVERFSNVDTGQSSTIDAPLMLDLVARAAATTTPGARALLDIGCGAGNYAIKLLQHLPGMDVTLLDLSRPMLDRAFERVDPVTAGVVSTVQMDIREFDAGEEQFDVIIAAAVLHHLREADEWRDAFAKCHAALRPGGSLWIVDLVTHGVPEIQALMWARYGDYLEAIRGPAYRDHVLAYVDQEDTPRPLMFQLDLLRDVGFHTVDVLHKTGCFAAFGALRG